MKANPITHFLHHVHKKGFGVEVASLPELVSALRIFPPAQICFDSPSKTNSEISEALAAGVGINADNLQELDRIAAFYAEPGFKSSSGLPSLPLEMSCS